MQVNLKMVNRIPLAFEGSRSFSHMRTIDIRTSDGAVAFTHTSEKNSLKETVELFLRNSRGKVLENIDFFNVDFSGINLNNTSFLNARFDKAIFYNSEICGSRFINCSFNGARFYGTRLYNSMFTGAEFYRTRFQDIEYCSALFTDEQLKWFRNYDQLSVLDNYKSDLWMKLLKVQAALPSLKEELKLGRIDGSSYSCDFCGTLARFCGTALHEIPGITPDVSSPVEQWFLLLNAGMTPENSEAARITLEWIEELEHRINAR